MRAEPKPLAAAAIAALLVVATFLPSRAGAPADLPERPAGYVTDRAGVVDPESARRIESLVAELRQKTGAEIAVVTVRTTKPEPIFDAAMALAEKWRPGSREKDNGVLILVAVDDRELQIVTGYGVEGVLPDGLVGEIRDRLLRPAFRRGDFGPGLLAAASAMARRIAAAEGVTLTGVPPAPRLAPRSRRASGAFPLLLFLFLPVFFAFGRSGLLGRRGRMYPGGLAGPLLLGGMLGAGRRRGFGAGGGFGGGFGGFGGFGGGSFGGGGAGGSW